MADKHRIGDEIEVKIEKIVPRGLGLGFADGLTIFVSLAAPGDVVRVRLREIKKRIAFAEVVEVIHGGPTRTSPPCPYFGTCGGCDFQQLDYPAQLAAKVDIIRDCLRRIGKIDTYPEITVVPSPAELAYRSRVRWHVDVPSRRIGYYARDSHTVIDIEKCPKITGGLNETLAEMRSTIEWNSFFNDRFDVEAAEGDGGGISVYSAEFADPPADVTSEIAGHRFTYNARTFFQANRLIACDLVKTATGGLTGETALDLYCGVGLFSLPLAGKIEKVIAVEEFGPAIANARKNSEHNGIHNIDFQERGVETFLTENRSGLAPDVVLLDPPRSGTEKHTVPLIASLNAKQISYVSCEPSILARDLRFLLDAGYTIASITAVDLFPQTHHVETVVHLGR